MSEYRYRLDRSSRKHPCPECGKRKLVRYVDSSTGDYLPEAYGRCDRESNCTYHLSPYHDGYATMIRDQEEGPNVAHWKPLQTIKKAKPKPQPEPVHIPHEVLHQTLQGYEKNQFIQNLLHHVPYPFEANDIEKVISLYYLGTIPDGYRRAGAITFPFIDVAGKVRTIQAKQFDEDNHTTGTDYVHSIMEGYHCQRAEALPQWLIDYKTNDLKVSCLFGEHLLSKYPLHTVALVEAPKTAIYGTLYFGLPQQPGSLLWLAVYNKSSFTLDRLKILKGREVVVFPDLSKDGSTYLEWQQKADMYEGQLPGTRFTFSDLLEKLAPDEDRQEGYDLADYLIKLDWRKFRKEPKAVEAVLCEKCEKCEPAQKQYLLLTKEPHSTEQEDKAYDAGLIGDLLTKPHHFTAREAVQLIIASRAFL